MEDIVGSSDLGELGVGIVVMVWFDVVERGRAGGSVVICCSRSLWLVSMISK
jgi:hypothetical protein